MDLASNYEIARTVDFIRSRSFSRVALQFPDELLKDSTIVARALRIELGRGVRLYVMADTAYGSCCVDEVGASHVDAECVVHYGHACMSPVSTLPALFVFGKASVDASACAEALHSCLSTSNKPILVLYGLEYAHALHNIKAVTAEILELGGSKRAIHYAEVTCSIIEPSKDFRTEKDQHDSHNCFRANDEILKHEASKVDSLSDSCNNLNPVNGFGLGGLRWNLPVGQKMDDYLLFWIGTENPAFSNIVLTFNSCDLVRYDAEESRLLNDFSQQRRILKRRYYLVEKAKDANIVGILVGTLGVAGYLQMVQKMKEMIQGAGKKSYTIVMGRPNAAKLANFPECDVFVFVSCSQTSLLDSKDFLSPVITPFEATLAFSRGRQWTGDYIMDFRNLMGSSTGEVVNNKEEARFSFFKGGYVEDSQIQENKGEDKERSLVLAEMTEKALSLKNQSTDAILFKGTATSAAEFLAARSYQGLDGEYDQTPAAEPYVIGRSGRASGYIDEKRDKQSPHS